MKKKILLAFILVFALTLRLKFFIGLNWSDDVNYVYLADQILKGKYKPSYMLSLRLMMIYPLALFFRVFGVSNLSATLYPLLTSLAEIVVVYTIAKLLFNDEVALTSAFILSIFPLHVIYATWIMPDVPLAFFLAFSVLLFLLAEKRNSKLLMLMSGMLGGMAYLLKLSGLMIFIFYFFIFLFKSFKRRKVELKYSLIFLGLFIILIAEGIFYYRMTGDFMLRYHRGFLYFSEKERLKHEFQTKFDFYPKVMFNLDNSYRFMFTNPYTYFGFFYFIVIISIIYFLKKKERKTMFPIAWFLIMFFYLQFGSMSFKEYIPMHRLTRHLTVLSAPSIILVSRFLQEKKFKRISIFLLTLLTLNFLYYIENIHYLQTGQVKDVLLIFDYLKEMPEKTIYSDPGTNGHLMFYFKFERNDIFRPINSLRCEEVRDSYVIVNATRAWVELKSLIESIPSCVRNPPENWKKVKVIKSDFLEYPFNLFDPVIYYVE